MLVDDDSRVATRTFRSRPSRPGPGDRTHGRLIAPVRGLPNGRAVLGGLLVTLAALGSYLVATSGDDDDLAPYVVAARDLAPGAALTAADLRVVPLELPPDQARGTFPTVAALAGAVMRGPLQAGAVVTASAVDRPAGGAGLGEASGDATHGAAAGNGTGTTPAYRELSLDLPAARAVGGDLRPGDRVDVVATADAVTHVLVQHALVVRVDGGRDSRTLGGAEVGVTLALPDATAALAVAHGGAAADLTLLRSTRANQPLPTTYQLPGAATRGGAGTAPAGPATTPSTGTGTGAASGASGAANAAGTGTGTAAAGGR